MDKDYLIHNIKIADNPNAEHQTLDILISNLAITEDITADVTIDHYINGNLNLEISNADVSLTGSGSGGGGEDGGAVLLYHDTITVEEGDTSSSTSIGTTGNLTNPNITEYTRLNQIVMGVVQRKTLQAGSYGGSTIYSTLANGSQPITKTGFGFYYDASGNIKFRTSAVGIYFDNAIYGVADGTYYINASITKGYNTVYTPNWSGEYDLYLYLIDAPHIPEIPMELVSET